ncbi:hypothetical protein [Algoriphagus marinus]|uniref:hypothetical protein n=1 Tax=Algoriphagus marinus TaxID=1925762 RepID=UPI0011154380|nr:hypothetical protein [Algoriphagus marinus]
MIIDFSDSYTFSKDGTFTYESRGDLGPINYGNGTYQLSKEQLAINYSTAKNINSEVNIESLEDDEKYNSVEFHFEFYDLENEKEVSATIFKYFENKSKNKVFNSNNRGICNIILPKGQEVQTYTISSLGYEIFEVEVMNNSSKTIKIGLAKSRGEQIFGKYFKKEISNYTKKEILFSDGFQLIKAKN